MRPLFFGNSERQLFGIYHEPDDSVDSSRQSRAVLLAYPGVQEYNTSHWAFRRLASMLNRAGLHVLRFDYFGTGDSMGRLEDGLPSLWTEDLHEAIAELRELSGAKQVSLVGLRLGAALAYLACDQKHGLDTLCLWDPVVSGAEYLRELQSQHDNLSLLLLHARRPQRLDELLGYPCTPEFRAQVEAIRLADAPPPAAKRIRIFVSQASPQSDMLSKTLGTRGLDCAIEQIASDAARPSGAAQTERAMLSNNVIVAISESLTRRVTAKAATS